MVEKFKKLLQEIIQSRGDVSIFAVAKMDDLTGKWTVILCAPWSENEKQRDAFGFIFQLLPKYFTDEEKNSIARISIFGKNEHLIELLLKYKNGSVIENEKVNGNLVHLAYILASNSNI